MAVCGLIGPYARVVGSEVNTVDVGASVPVTNNLQWCCTGVGVPKGTGLYRFVVHFQDLAPRGVQNGR